VNDTNNQPRRRGRPPKFDKGEALGAAMLQFWRHGYEATSLRDLTDAMGLNPPSLYAAFGDKKSLFQAAVVAYQDGPGCFAAEILADETDSRTAVERLLREAARRFTDKDTPPGCMVVTSAIACASDAEDVEAFLRDIRRSSAVAIKARIAEGARKGELPKHLDPRSFGDLVVTVFQGLSIQARDGASRKDLDAIVSSVMALWPPK
jgi:TetR/AcrR family transcriptional regulator, copper-responsive repressor